MQEKEFMRVVHDIVQRDERYHIDSYSFVREALEYTAKLLERPVQPEGTRHVSGSQLLEGIRSYALEMLDQ